MVAATPKSRACCSWRGEPSRRIWPTRTRSLRSPRAMTWPQRLWKI